MNLNRRDFFKVSAATGLALSTSSLLSACHVAEAVESKRYGANDKLNVLSIGVVGSIGGADRGQIASHKGVNIVGLCDVDSNYLAKAAKDHPSAFQCKDYREAFAKYGDQFDAVQVSTPDHTHCAIMTLALSKGKHVYGQKPLVQQLEELVILKNAVKARPGFSTQMGNQRMQNPGRRAFVDILKRNVLGKAKEAWVVTGSGPIGGGGYFFGERQLKPAIAPPATLDWELWRCGTTTTEFHEGIVPLKWRTWWDYGTGGLGDWGCHLLDVIFYAYPELDSPTKVITDTAYKVDVFHADHCRSTLTYPVTGNRFAADTFKVHYADEGQMPDRKVIPHLGEGGWPGGNLTIVACEGGTLVLEAGGALQVWREGKVSEGLKEQGLPEFKGFNHWHEWVNTALSGKPGENHWSPFDVGLKITEGALLAVKATRFPGQELHWDRAKLKFTNHDEATRTIVKRQYRAGFEPVRL